MSCYVDQTKLEQRHTRDAVESEGTKIKAEMELVAVEREIVEKGRKRDAQSERVWTSNLNSILFIVIGEAATAARTEAIEAES